MYYVYEPFINSIFLKNLYGLLYLTVLKLTCGIINYFWLHRDAFVDKGFAQS
jgi:hypothetical protein